MIGPAISPEPMTEAIDARPRLRVLVADPDGLARSMLRTAIGERERVSSVSVAGDGREALGLAAYLHPAVLVLDTALLAVDGIGLIEALLTASPETRILTIAVDDQRTALRALRAGAVGHLGKELDPSELASLVIQAADGQAVVPQELLMPLLELLRQVPDAGWRPLHSRLTTREWQIVELLSERASTEEIAERLVLSVTTVYSHVKSVLRKLGVHSRREAVTAAERLRREEAMGRKAPTDQAANSPARLRDKGKFGEGRASSRGVTPIPVTPRAIHNAPHPRGKAVRPG